MGVARVALFIALFGSAACQSNVGRAAVSLGVHISKESPGDASVFIDEEYVGPLGYVAAHGVRLPVGEHRVTVKREGYFPWDRLVVADRKPVTLEVTLDRIPD